MDKALDDVGIVSALIVQASRTGRRGAGRRPNRSARAKILGNTSTTAAKTAAKKAAAGTQVAGKVVTPQQTAEKIMVSGLPADVNEQQIKELFTTTVGPLKDVQLHFNPQGKWNGTATVLFSRKGDGTKAYEQYNNRLIDGS
ncbi:uncharacterized protein FOMMEDRAFT_162024 [Fomitiporia mediterranea MF3/22]|uniref:uncharacterized protein n=1 Tax=Fomitiporia mediterranea (strain MF3/22) TaxID=694068 RepID=UPI0004408DFC|nr:uncharacterized protein FOMMEDRAFT_162024 [Fomitiporia mediterranea MF3/22]EJC98265.1 hypothetical protein FOMMEDRAFT_162024 [Fomitiporia mediterranea MF3/22]